MLAGLTRIFAEIDVGAPSTFIPIGTVTGMLVAVFVLFLRDSARNDERADINAAKMIAAAESERDRVRADFERAEARWATERQALEDRIRHLERILYGGAPA